MQVFKQRIRQESECQLEAGTCPKHCWNSFTDCYSPGTSTKLTSVHCLKWPRLQKSLDDVGFIISSWKKLNLCTRCRKIFILLWKRRYHVTQGREKIKKELLVVLPILSFPHHILSAISALILSKSGLKVVNITCSYSLMC